MHHNELRNQADVQAEKTNAVVTRHQREAIRVTIMARTPQLQMQTASCLIKLSLLLLKRTDFI